MGTRDKIIIIGLIIVIIALIGIAIYMFNGQHQKSTQIEVIGNGTIEENGTLTVKLSLLNNTGINNKTMNLVVIDKNNKKVLEKTVNTNSEGKANVDIKNISKGEYVINITFEGDKNYSANTTSKEIKIIEKKANEKTSETTQNTTSTQHNEKNTDDLGLSQHKANDFEYVGTYADGEHYKVRGGGELVMHGDAYEYYDGHGNVVGGLNV